MALVAALAVALAAGLAWRARNGKIRTVAVPAGSAAPDGPGPDGPSLDGPLLDAMPPARKDAAWLTAADIGQPLGDRATLLQFSSAFCAPCRATRVLLADVARRAPGVAHVEIDAESHLDLVRALGVLRTPTMFVLDAGGAITARASGQPRKADVIGALGAVLPAGSSYSSGLETG